MVSLALAFTVLSGGCGNSKISSPAEINSLVKELQEMADQGTLVMCQNEGGDAASKDASSEDAFELAELVPAEESAGESIAEEPRAPQISQIRHILKSVNLDFVPHREWFKGIPVGLLRMSKESFRITGNKLQDSWTNSTLTCRRLRAKAQEPSESTPIDQGIQAEEKVESKID